jgi:hypothetical protein
MEDPRRLRCDAASLGRWFYLPEDAWSYPRKPKSSSSTSILFAKDRDVLADLEDKAVN